MQKPMDGMLGLSAIVIAFAVSVMAYESTRGGAGREVDPG
jgi:hypothetical protein